MRRWMLSGVGRASSLLLILGLLCASSTSAAESEMTNCRKLLWWGAAGAVCGMVGGAIFNYVQPDPEGTSQWPGYVTLLPSDMLVGALIGTGVGVAIPIAVEGTRNPGVVTLGKFLRPERSGVSAAVLFESVLEQLSRKVNSDESVRAFVLDFTDEAGKVSSTSSRLTDELRVHVVQSASFSLLERELLDVAVHETEFTSYLLSNSPERAGNLAFFAPADVVVAGRVTRMSEFVVRVFIRAFSTSDGVVLVAESQDVDVRL